MADPFRKVHRGDELPLSATAWNAMLDAGRAFRMRQNDQSSGPLTQTREASIVPVLNDTGDNLPMRAVVGLNGPIFDPGESAEAENAFLREIAFRGVTPAVEHRGRFAILLAPAAPDQVVRAYVAGFVQVRVDMLDEGHKFADIDPGETGHLVSTDAGAAKIVWTQGDVYGGYGYGAYGDGVQWAMVQIGQIYGGLIRAQAPSGGIAAGASGACKVYDPDHALGTYTISARNRTGNDVGDEADVYVAWIEREREFQVVQEVCPEAYA